jgi:hypothetical protein
LLQCMSPLLAQSGHWHRAERCPLLADIGWATLDVCF